MRYAYATNHNHLARFRRGNQHKARGGAGVKKPPAGNLHKTCWKKPSRRYSRRSNSFRRIRPPRRPARLRMLLNKQRPAWTMPVNGEQMAWLLKHMAVRVWKIPPVLRVRLSDEEIRTAGPSLEPKAPGANLSEALFNGSLNEKQHELVRLLLAGMTIRAAARRMGYSTRWAQYQLRKIRRRPKT